MVLTHSQGVPAKTAVITRFRIVVVFDRFLRVLFLLRVVKVEVS